MSNDVKKNNNIERVNDDDTDVDRQWRACCQRDFADTELLHQTHTYIRRLITYNDIWLITI